MYSLAASVPDLDNGATAIVLPNRQLLVVERTRLLGESVSGSGAIDTLFWASTVVGTGTATKTAGDLVVGTGVGANAAMAVQSVPRGRLLAGHVCVFHTHAHVEDAGVVDNTRRWGAFDATDGFFFELAGTTLYAVARKSSVDTRTAATAWSAGVYTGSVVTPARYEIFYSPGGAWFYINGKLRHTLGVNGSPYVANPNLPVRFESTNSNGLAQDVRLSFSGCGISRFGKEASRPRYANLGAIAATVLKTGAATLHRVTVNRNSAGNGLLTVYDSTTASGTVVARIALDKAVLSTQEFNCDLSTGLTAEITGSGTGDVTVLFD